MDYLLDTVTLVRYLTQKGKITPVVLEIFRQAEDGKFTFLISSISLMEILYLGEKYRIETTVEETIKAIKSSDMYRVIDLTADIILTATTVDFYELHDRMILATAKYYDVPVISPDKKFKKIDNITVIW
ncbi:MAG: PIN domain-containing protein [Bacteroidia bacterium]|nr:PIN domain-containing protein [Bacteroidia bacterium]